ncbi:MAG: hypothetical protein LUC83_03895 [Clostridiales bacterium]|nr:hypothetical protein [Clostridiales bacterium]
MMSVSAFGAETGEASAEVASYTFQTLEQYTVSPDDLAVSDYEWASENTKIADVAVTDDGSSLQITAKAAGTEQITGKRKETRDVSNVGDAAGTADTADTVDYIESAEIVNVANTANIAESGESTGKIEAADSAAGILSGTADSAVITVTVAPYAGVLQDPTGVSTKYYYYAAGVKKSYTGFAKGTDGTWYYVESGSVTFGKNVPCGEGKGDRILRYPGGD